MEQTGSEKTSATPVVFKALAAVVTADVGIAIYQHWQVFDVLKKGLAIILLASLVAWPAMAILARRRGGSFQWQGLLPAYIWVLTATMLFGLRA
jgi:glucose-6-phosphate-specific signal transduction histidine kinase